MHPIPIANGFNDWIMHQRLSEAINNVEFRKMQKTITTKRTDLHR